MLLQTNSYIVPKERRAEHARLMNRFRQVLGRIGCDHFEVYEQVGANWNGTDSSGRFVQIMRFRDNKHRQTVQTAERQSAEAQGLVREFCDLVNMAYQEEQGLFATGYYQGVITAPRVKPGLLTDEGEAESSVAPTDPICPVTEQPLAPVSVDAVMPPVITAQAHEHVALDLDDLSDDDSEIEPLGDEEILEAFNGEPLDSDEDAPTQRGR